MDLQTKKHEVVVVEGYHDLAKLNTIFPKLDIVITNGSEISKQTLQELKQLNETRGLILFLDPDFPGQKIRQTINNFVGPTKHAHLAKEQCISKNKKKVGIEHAQDADIIEALENVLTPVTTNLNPLTIQDLFDLKLSGCKEAKSHRKTLCDNTGIGLSNAKTLLKKLNMFGITKEQIKTILGT